MRQPENWKMTPLDALLCSNHLQIMKSLVFLFPPAKRRQIILLIKLMELRECLALPAGSLYSETNSMNTTGQGPELLEAIFPYCDQEHQQSFRQFQQAMQMMNTIRQFSDSGLFTSPSEAMGNAPFSTMMTPDQQALMKEYEAMLDAL